MDSLCREVFEQRDLLVGDGPFHASLPKTKFAADSALEGDGFEPSVPREDEPRKGAVDPLTPADSKAPHHDRPAAEEGGFELLGCRPPGAPFFEAGGRRSGRLGLARPSNNHANIARSTGYSAPLCPVNLRMTRRTQVSQLKRAYWTEPHEFSSGQER